MENTNTNLGRLERVDLREAWEKEAGDFTPWLADEVNISLLGDTIGLELEVEAQEKSVGPFRADILCKDTATDNWVLIENQLERTDHLHLGQLITYASGLNAVTIVWIAKRFTDEHRAALDWLNEMTGEDINFFGLEMELWKIGGSDLAPKLNVVSSPNDWTKRVAQGAKNAHNAALTPAKEMQLEFWSGFREYVEIHGAAFKPTKPQPQHWMTVAIGRSGFRLNAIVSLWDSESESYDNHELRAELELHDNNAKTYFSQLQAMQVQIEEELGEALTWYNPDDKKICRLFIRATVDLNDRDKWPDYYKWLKEKLDALRNVFGTRVRQLDADAALSVD